MTKLTDMCATARRQAARRHRVEANVTQIEMDAETGFTPRFAALKIKHTFHAAQAKLWELAAAQAEASGFVRVS